MSTDPQDSIRIGALERDVAQLKRTVAFLLQELKLQYQDVNPESAIDAQLRDLLNQKRAIDAVRLYRDSTGASLSEAKAYVDQLAKGPR
jgi:ribosomal protein L7/L12